MSVSGLQPYLVGVVGGVIFILVAMAAMWVNRRRIE